jgi:hypothetical protein
VCVGGWQALMHLKPEERNVKKRSAIHLVVQAGPPEKCVNMACISCTPNVTLWLETRRPVPSC